MSHQQFQSDRQFQFFSFSAAKSGKEKCGDAFVVRQMKDENLILLAVADGVSSLPCDWFASKTACETLVAAFEKTKGPLPVRMTTAAAKANSAVRAAVTGACRGMMTSLSFAVWKTGEDEIHFLNVGDSRIYVGPEAGLEQITVDDAVSIPAKHDGKALLLDGMPVFRRGVTRSLGQSEPLKFEVQTHKFSNIDLLVLVSDGICKNEAFTSELKDIFASACFSAKLEQFVKNNSEKNKDDATLVVLWRTETDESLRAVYAECLREKTDFRAKELNAGNMRKFLQSELLGNLSNNANEKVNELLDYAQRYRLKFGREFLSGFLSAVIKQGKDRDLASRLRELIRVSE